MPDGSAGGAPRAALAGPVATLPNLISLLRLCAVPVAIYLVMLADWLPALVVFVLAAMSDALDGFLARRGRMSRLGAVLDPLADKALLTTLAVALAAEHRMPDWYAILVVFRDVVIVGGILIILVLGERVEIRPLYSSKLNTVLQGLLIAGVLGLAACGRTGGLWLAPLIWMSAATTVASGVAYVRTAVRLHGV